MLTAETSGTFAATSDMSDPEGVGKPFSATGVARGGDIEGTTGSSHTLTGDEEELSIPVWVSFTDDSGNPERLTRPGDPRRLDGMHLRNRVQRGMPVPPQ